MREAVGSFSWNAGVFLLCLISLSNVWNSTAGSPSFESDLEDSENLSSGLDEWLAPLSEDAESRLGVKLHLETERLVSSGILIDSRSLCREGMLLRFDCSNCCLRALMSSLTSYTVTRLGKDGKETVVFTCLDLGTPISF